jgi:hypothetical protein
MALVSVLDFFFSEGASFRAFCDIDKELGMYYSRAVSCSKLSYLSQKKTVRKV